MKKNRKVKFGQGDYLLTVYTDIGMKISKTIYPNYTEAIDAGESLEKGKSYTVALIMFNSLERAKSTKWEP